MHLDTKFIHSDMTISTHARLGVLIGLALIAPALSTPLSVQAAQTCVFTTDLTLGTESEDVRCLQRYLNANGFQVSATGVGSPGYETTQYKSLTVAAVTRWQTAKGVLPATGTFGQKSRAKYAALVLSSTPVVPATPTVPTAPVTSSIENQTREALIKAKVSLNEIQDDIEEAEDDGDDVGDAQEYLEKAEDYMIDALYAFLEKDFADALDSSLSLSKAIRDARSEIRDNIDEEDKAKEAITDAEDAIDEAQEAIDEADEDGDDVDDAEDKLEEAKDKLDEADDAWKDDDFEEAYDLAREAEQLAEDAEDEL